MSDTAILIAVVGIGGVVLYILTRPSSVVTPPPVTIHDMQCGASYAGVGASVPCTLLGQGIKELYGEAKSVLEKSGVSGEVTTATSGFGLADVALAPVGITHAAYNEVKRLKFW